MTQSLEEVLKGLQSKDEKIKQKDRYILVGCDYKQTELQVLAYYSQIAAIFFETTHGIGIDPSVKSAISLFHNSKFLNLADALNIELYGVGQVNIIKIKESTNEF